MRLQKNRRGGLTQPKVTQNEQNDDNDTDNVENISTHKLFLLCDFTDGKNARLSIELFSPSFLNVFAAKRMSGWLASGSRLFTGFRDGFERAQVRSDLIGRDEVQ